MFIMSGWLYSKHTETWLNQNTLSDNAHSSFLFSPQIYCNTESFKEVDTVSAL